VTGQVDDLLDARQLASLEALALAYLREDPAEVTR
jgi:DNA-binding FadR family transcriptional regulator